MLIKDQYGFEYHEWRDPTWVKVKESDIVRKFIEINQEYDKYYKPKIGMKYIVYSTLRHIYEQYEITEHTIDQDILPFIKQGRLFLLSS